MKKDNYKIQNYLSSCDLINKHNSKTLYKNAKIENVTIFFPISKKNEDIVPVKDFKEYINNLILIYCILGKIPEIKFFKKSSSAFKKEDVFNNYVLKISINKKEEILQFVQTLFAYQSNLFLLKVVHFGPILKGKNFICTFLVPLSLFFDVKLLGLDFVDFNLKINFLIKGYNFKRKDSLVKNLPFFWISG